MGMFTVFAAACAGALVGFSLAALFGARNYEKGCKDGYREGYINAQKKEATGEYND